VSARCGVHELFTATRPAFTPGSRRVRQGGLMGDLIAVLGTLAFFAAMLGLVWGLDRL
jgi:hypothetical protein